MALGLFREWLQNLDTGLPKADLTILVEMSPDVVASSRTAAGKDVLERNVFLAGQGDCGLLELVGAGGWAVVETQGDKEEGQEKVLMVVKRLMPTEIGRRET